MCTWDIAKHAFMRVGDHELNDMKPMMGPPSMYVNIKGILNRT